MLTTCPECNGTVSEFAPICPHCGFLLKESTTSLPIAEKCVKKANTRHKKLPNNFGTIQKLNGTRTNPYVAYPPYRRSDYNDNGVPKRKKALGYFKTYQDAYKCLIEHQDGKKISSPLFSEIYEKWYAKEIDILPMGASRRATYKSAYAFCKPLYNIPVDEIHTEEIQNIIDSCGKGYSTKSNIKYLCNNLFKYCISNAILSVNYASFVKIGENDNEHGVPLSKAEIKRLWDHSDNKDVQICLIFIYTGYRIQELKVCNIDLENRVMTGGVKNKTSRNRIVPIHHLIYDFVKDFDQDNFGYQNWRSNGFKRAKELCGIEETETGENRTPHDFRHTFSALCDEYGVDPMSKRMIMGHAKGKDVSDNVYGHRDIEILRKEIEKIKR